MVCQTRDGRGRYPTICPQQDRIVFNAESLMSITISNLTVSNTAPTGTTIGLLTTTDASGTVIPCSYILTKGSIGAGYGFVTEANMRCNIFYCHQYNLFILTIAQKLDILSPLFWRFSNDHH